MNNFGYFILHKMNYIRNFNINRIFTTACINGDTKIVKEYIDQPEYIDIININEGFINAVKYKQIRIMKLILNIKREINIYFPIIEEFDRLYNRTKDFSLITLMLNNCFNIDKLLKDNLFIIECIKHNYLYGIQLIINLKNQKLLNKILLNKDNIFEFKDSISKIEISILLIEGGANINLIKDDVIIHFINRFVNSAEFLV